MSQLLSILKKAKRLQPQGFFFLSVYTLNVNQIMPATYKLLSALTFPLLTCLLVLNGLFCYIIYLN